MGAVQEGDKTWQSVDLHGVIDVHVHSAPDLAPRSGDDLDVARDAARAGMRAIVLKSHHTLTSTRAYLCQKVLDSETQILGGLALNPAAGGLNPAAVDTALKLGARVVWMPTFSARNQRQHDGEGGGIGIFDEAGRILPAVIEIVDLLATARALLCTGHLSPVESLALIRLGRERHLERVLVTHPEMYFIGMTVDQQREAVRLGALLERDYVTTTRYGRHMPLERIAEIIRAVGVESSVLATDLGQPDNPRPVEGMQRYLAGLSRLGFTEHELRTMAGSNPARLLNLES